MNRKILDASWCPIARSLGPLGDPWALLILRDAFYGLTRFDEFEQSLGVAPNILSGRLKQLVGDGLLERHRYSEHPPRYEYRLTEAGRDTRPVALALMEWGNRHLAPEGRSVVLVDTETGKEAQPTMVDRVSGRPLSDPAFRLAAGPKAPAAVRSRFDEARRRGP
jgi:DNA-binding HxlR family transcriptional regulator